MKQRTIANAITVVGIGLHSGQEVTLRLLPSESNTGIRFLRSDIANAPFIEADAFLVQDTVMSSNLVKDGTKIGTVEHLLGAIAGLGIDNVLIEVSAAEIPILDGSAAPYIASLLKAGIKEQEALKRFMRIDKTVRVSDADKWAELTPFDGYALNFEIDFDHPAIPKATQKYHFDFSSKNFINYISNARTFGFMQDIEYLQKNNLALGGSLDNAIVLDDQRIINEGGLRYADEFVRHKILDAIGDLYLARYPLIGQFNAYKSGHSLNNKLIRTVLQDRNNFEIVTFYDNDKLLVNYCY